MLFNATLTLSRISQNQIATLKNSLAAHEDFFTGVRSAFLIALLVAALAAAAYSGILDEIFFQGNITYGVPEMEETTQFMGTGLSESM